MIGSIIYIVIYIYHKLYIEANLLKKSRRTCLFWKHIYIAGSYHRVGWLLWLILLVTSAIRDQVSWGHCWSWLLLVPMFNWVQLCAGYIIILRHFRTISQTISHVIICMVIIYYYEISWSNIDLHHTISHHPQEGPICESQPTGGFQGHGAIQSSWMTLT